MNYLFRVLMSLSQLLNTILGGRVDHTFSGRVGRAAEEGKTWGKIMAEIIDTLFFFDPDHCARSIERDELKKPLHEVWK